MKTIEQREEILNEDRTRGLIEEGYSLMSYDGELSLVEKDRTRKNVCDGELSLRGAQMFRKKICENVASVTDTQIVRNKGGSYDVYAKINMGKSR